jgi:outer membrane protein OmpA-like peptidoglycan-associated protein/tetratricopeptide (TPR) repeat protein
MKNFCFPLQLILLLLSTTLSAQTDLLIKKKDFKAENTGFRDAWKHVQEGDKYFFEGGTWYNGAYDEYLKAIAYNSLNPALNYKTGVAALFSDRKDEASEFLLKALSQEPGLTDDILYLTGRSLQYAGRYSEAIEKFDAYLASAKKKEKETIASARRHIEECNNAITLTGDTLRISITNAGSLINTNADEYSPVLSADRNSLYFASRKQLTKSSTYYDDTRFDENIYLTTSVNGEWSVPLTLGKKLTTALCEAPLSVSTDGTQLFLYAGYENGGDIMSAELKKGKWKGPSSIPYRINTSGAETAFAFSPTGNEIWFITDKSKDALGGSDIFYIKKIGEKKWSKPVNPGPSVNTQYDEASVSLSDRGDTLWFSSRGHNSIGGFDIFYSAKDSAGNWGSAVNAGFPVNTAWDELYYTPVRGDDSTFYLSTNRSGGLGGLDICRIEILPPEPVILPPAPAPDTVVVRDTVVVIREIVPEVPVAEPVIVPVPEPVKELVLYLIGSVKDSETAAPVLAKIDLIDLSTDQVVTTTASSDVDGSYRIRLPEKKSYMIDLRATGFLSDMKRITIPADYAEEVFTLDVSLIKVKVGKKVVLNNILFETGKTVLTPGSYAELDRLRGILEDAPQMKIEISGHTDNTGSLAINLRLSEERAKAVTEYLVSKGIDRTRLQFRGYGPEQPIADNSTPAGRTQNRRVEFKILEF